MKVWTNNQFVGLWPVPTAAVVVADTVEEAERLLRAEVEQFGLADGVHAKDFELLPTEAPAARVLSVGDY